MRKSSSWSSTFASCRSARESSRSQRAQREIDRTAPLTPAASRCLAPISACLAGPSWSAWTASSGITAADPRAAHNQRDAAGSDIGGAAAHPGSSEGVHVHQRIRSALGPKPASGVVPNQRIRLRLHASGAQLPGFRGGLLLGHDRFGDRVADTRLTFWFSRSSDFCRSSLAIVWPYWPCSTR